jgi:hypothetical protein
MCDYYLLALSHKHVRLFEGDRYRLKPVELKNFSGDLEETLRIDEFPHSRETHTIAPASSGKGSEAFHQQYNVAETDKKMLLEFFRRIDHRLHAFLLFHEKPLLLAGVGYLLPIYRKVNTYAGLLDEAVIGNQDRTDIYTLGKKAWQTVGTTLGK